MRVYTSDVLRAPIDSATAPPCFNRNMECALCPYFSKYSYIFHIIFVSIIVFNNHSKYQRTQATNWSHDRPWCYLKALVISVLGFEKSSMAPITHIINNITIPIYALILPSVNIIINNQMSWLSCVHLQFLGRYYNVSLHLKIS